MNNNGITETEVFAMLGRLYAENQLLRQQLVLLQQQIARGRQVQTNGETSTEEIEAIKERVD